MDTAVTQVAQATSDLGGLQQVAATSIAGMVAHIFSFSEDGTQNPNPGRELRQETNIDVPPQATPFIAINLLNAGFVGAGLLERPFGQLFAEVKVEGDKLVCRVRLHNLNDDDPILVEVGVHVLFIK